MIIKSHSGDVTCLFSLGQVEAVIHDVVQQNQHTRLAFGFQPELTSNL